jgi:hypothetical protein
LCGEREFYELDTQCGGLVQGQPLYCDLGLILAVRRIFAQQSANKQSSYAIFPVQAADSICRIPQLRLKIAGFMVVPQASGRTSSVATSVEILRVDNRAFFAVSWAV